MIYPLIIKTWSIEGFRENPNAQYSIEHNDYDDDLMDLITNAGDGPYDWEITIPNRFAYYQLISDLASSAVEEIQGYASIGTTPGDDASNDYIPGCLELASYLASNEESDTNLVTWP